MPSRKASTKPAQEVAAPRRSRPAAPSGFAHARDGARGSGAPPPTVSARWLLTAAGVSIVAAGLCAWGALCLLFWQGSWQLLYHPVSAVTRTPASVGLAFDPVAFASTEAGEPRLRGWWIPAEAQARFGRYTVLYLHRQDGNLGDCVDDLAGLHAAGVNVLAFDYRGYGQSQFQRPSEARWREDANWALQYLTGTRHVAANSIIVDGRDLGANLALEIAAEHPDLAGVIVREPLDQPVNAIFRDPRAELVPAHWLVRDRFDFIAPIAVLRIPSLWFAESQRQADAAQGRIADAYARVPAKKMRVWLPPNSDATQDFMNALMRWLEELHS